MNKVAYKPDSVKNVDLLTAELEYTSSWTKMKLALPYNNHVIGNIVHEEFYTVKHQCECFNHT